MAVQVSHETKTVTATGPSASDLAVTLTLGPKPYNRFLGNPPVGQTPDECFKEENGYDWVTELNSQPFADLVHGLEVKLTDAKKGH